MALTSCENEAINEGIEANDTYTMTFTAGAPESRTSVAINGATATYSWSANDQMGFVQYAVGANKTNRTGSKETTIEGNVATFTTEFEAQVGATAYNYAAYYPYTTPANEGTKTFDNIVLNFPARQAYTEGTFAPAADLLMSKTITEKTLNAHGGKLEFARLVAVGKMTLSDIEDGETIKNVRFTIENAVLSGQVTLDFVNTTAEYATVGNNYIEVYGDNVGNEIIFTCFPGTYTGNYSIAVETDKATYLNENSFTKDFTLTAGNVLAFDASAGERTEKPAELTEDILNRAFTGISDTTYTAWTDKIGESGAVYAGQSAGGNDAIQLRSNNNNSGIVTTTSGGYATKVTVAWNSNTANDRVLEVYGKNSAYTQATDLYNDATAGTLLGTIVYGTTTELAINYDFQYIGLRSKSGAMYLDQVKITWSEEATGNVPTQLATPSNVNATVDGKDVTLTWDTVDNAGSYSITVVGGNTYTTTGLTKTLTMDAYETEYEFSIVATSDVIDYSTSEAFVIRATTGEAPETPGTGDGGEGGGEEVSTLTVETINAVKTMGNGSYGDYSSAQEITVDGVTYKAFNICANMKGTPTNYAAQQVIQMRKSAAGYFYNTNKTVKSIKVWSVATNYKVCGGNTSNPTTQLTAATTTTETIAITHKTSGTLDVEMQVEEYNITDGYFALVATATCYIYKIEVTYAD